MTERGTQRPKDDLSISLENRACESSESRWSSPSMDSRSSRGFTNTILDSVSMRERESFQVASGCTTSAPRSGNFHTNSSAARQTRGCVPEQSLSGFEQGHTGTRTRSPQAAVTTPSRDGNILQP
ncbi:hypothetical protein EVAR_52285_1 [Eumeta japonica]|uniref:Uncharacterized protein n=1 Tax=Eumeta variegata TaxID=151549 RepID=A0A4C1ZKC0_EUMVA|nr:hypothetical protein EVAR_52285_1 [Eumeta japonica]